jgi:serine/threonine protein kinase
MKCPACASANDEGVAHCFTCGAALTSTTVIRKGAVIASRYEIQETLGKGGMGTVYKAYDHILDEQVALKVLRPDMVAEQDMARRFRLEIKLARKVRHKNVCGIHEYGEEGGLRFIAMEYIDGTDLRKVLSQRGALPMAEAFDIAIAVSLGLQAIHEAGIIHRDLKTPNIMVDGSGQIRLMDFGIAKQSGGTGATLSGTAMGMIVGTPEYMSPEQGRGEKVDFRSDVYALGVVIYEIFTGSVPFRGETPIATIFKHLQEPPPLTGPKAARLPTALLPVLAKALAKLADDRYNTVAELVEAAKQARSAALAAAPPAPIDTIQGTVMLKREPSPAPTPAPITAVPTDVRTSVGTLSGQKLAEERERALLEASASIEAALKRGAVDEAASALDRVRARVGDDDALPTLAMRISEAQQKVEQARQRAEAEKQRKVEEDAQRRAEEEKRRAEAQARRQAEEAQKRADEDRRRAEEAQRRAEQEKLRAEDAQRQKLRTAALSQVEQLVRNGDHDGAQKALAEAVVAYGQSPDLNALSSRIEKDRQRAAAERALLEVLGRAESLLAAGDFEDAHKAAEEAVKAGGSDSRPRALLTRVEKEWRTHAVADAETHVRAAMDQGAFDDADAELRRAEEGLGKPTFKALRKELDNRRAAAKKQQQRDATAQTGTGTGTAATGQRITTAPSGPSGIKIAAIAAAITGVIAVGVLWQVLRPKPTPGDIPAGEVTPGPVAAGTASVIVDALPWGEVTEIVDALGKTHPVGEERFTPVVVALPAGEYTITVRDPAQTASTRLKVTVPASGSVTTKAEFRPVSADDYFSRAGFK